MSQRYVSTDVFVSEPVLSGRDGADEPPTLIKEDLLSAGTVRRSATDTQVSFLKKKKAKLFPLEMIEGNKLCQFVSFISSGGG